MPPGNPTQHVDGSRIAHIPGESVGDHFEQKMGGGVFVGIDVRLYVNAIDSVDGLPFFLVESELDIGFPELNLFEAAGSMICV